MGKNVITEARYKQNGKLVSYPLGTKAENVTVGDSTLDVELNDIKEKTDTSFTTPTDTNLANLNPSGETVSSAFVKIYKAIKKLISHISNNTNGENHIPKDGKSGQILLWASSGKAKWGANPASYSNFKGATSSAAGSTGLVPAPAAGKQTSYLRGDGTWQVPPGSTYTAGNGLLLSGNTFSINKMPDKTTTGGLGYLSADAGKLIPTNNTLAYWNGCCDTENTKSNLTHCNQGEFGAAATKSVISAYSGITSNASGLVTGGALYDYLTKFVQYVNKNGDTMTGDLSIVKTTSNETKLTIGNSLKSGAFKVDTGGNLGVFDVTKGKWLIKSDTSGNVTLNGYSLNKSVPSNAKFTDTTYSSYGGAVGSIGTTAGLVPAPDNSDKWWGFLRGDGQWVRPTDSLTDGDGSRTPVQSGAVYEALQPVVKDSGIKSFSFDKDKISNMIDDFIITKGTWIVIASGIFYNTTVPIDTAEFGFKTANTPGFPTDQPSCYGKAINWSKAKVEDKISINLSTVITVTQNTICVLKGKGSLQQQGSPNVECDCRIIAVKIGL